MKTSIISSNFIGTCSR